jgi:ribonuclease HII
MTRRESERRQRFERLRAFDRDADAEAWAAGRLAGVDEVGVGPLAGPVVAAAVILPPDFELPALFDSKRLTARERRDCARTVRAQALQIGLARVSPARIDRINIRRAMLAAHRAALARLDPAPVLVLVDGHVLPRLPAGARGRAVVRGDAQSLAIAAASVVAKVVRDRIMLRLHQLYPAYGFAEHKGYATAAHRQALRDHGLSPVHRQAFCGFLVAETLRARQTTLALGA